MTAAAAATVQARPPTRPRVLVPTIAALVAACVGWHQADTSTTWSAALALLHASFWTWFVYRYFDGSEYVVGLRYWPAFSNLSIWRRIIGYFPGRVEFSVPLNRGPGTSYLFGVHPHGVLSANHGMLMFESGTDFGRLFPGHGRVDLNANILYRIPFVRDFLLFHGGIDASRACASEALALGKSMVIMVGGEQEQIVAQRGEHIAYVTRRKGFIRLALQSGTPIVPGYCFGESELYRTFSFGMGFRKWLVKNVGVAIPLFVGPYWWCPIVPFQVPLVTVFGAPIETRGASGGAGGGAGGGGGGGADGGAGGGGTLRGEKPDEKEVDRVHALYVEGLLQVFDDNKERLGYKGAELRIL